MPWGCGRDGDELDLTRTDDRWSSTLVSFRADDGHARSVVDRDVAAYQRLWLSAVVACRMLSYVVLSSSPSANGRDVGYCHNDDRHHCDEYVMLNDCQFAILPQSQRKHHPVHPGGVFRRLSRYLSSNPVNSAGRFRNVRAAAADRLPPDHRDPDHPPD